MDPVGSIPIFVAKLKHFSSKRQRWIIIREMVIALAIMVGALFFGREFFDLIHVDESALSITGGTILLLIAIKMVFAKVHKESEIESVARDPIIVPLAMPLTAGPGILVAILLYSSEGLASQLIVLAAISIAWLFSLPLLLLSPEIKKFIGNNGAVAVERLFGFILILISVQMFLSGIISTTR